MVVKSKLSRTTAAGEVSRSNEIVVFCIIRDSACAECGEDIGKGRFLRMEADRPLCLACADLDHLVFLPRGDAALTRRADKYSTPSTSRSSRSVSVSCFLDVRSMNNGRLPSTRAGSTQVESAARQLPKSLKRGQSSWPFAHTCDTRTRDMTKYCPRELREATLAALSPTWWRSAWKNGARGSLTRVSDMQIH